MTFEAWIDVEGKQRTKWTTSLQTRPIFKRIHKVGVQVLGIELASELSACQPNKTEKLDSRLVSMRIFEQQQLYWQFVYDAIAFRKYLA